MTGKRLLTVAFLTTTMALSLASPSSGLDRSVVRSTGSHFTNFNNNGAAASQGNSNCHMYSPQELNATKCTSTIRAEAGKVHGDFKDLLILMTDAERQESRHDFVVYTTTFMYQYIHCASELHAIADLFYSVPMSHMPPYSSEWWQQALDVLHPPMSLPSGDQLVGRRKRAEPADADKVLLLQKIKNVARDTIPACIQWLIDHFLGISKTYFFTKHPSFPDPVRYTQTAPAQTSPASPTTPPSSLQTTTTTTTAATTEETTTAETTTKETTTRETTSATQTTIVETSTTETTTPGSTATTGAPTSPPSISASASTSTSTSTSASVSTPSMISSPTSSAAVPVSCAVCSGLDCLISTPDQLTKKCDGGLCMVHMVESAHLGRTINRSCGTQSSCLKVQNNPAQCQKVEKDQLDWDTQCYFCCQADMCNSPPFILPEKASWSPSPVPLDGR